MKKGTRIILIVFLILVLLISIGATVYPLFYSWYSQRHSSELKTEYEEQIQQFDNNKLEEAAAAAREYNNKLANGVFSPLEYEQNGYYELVNVTGNGIIGFLDIPKINLSLTVFHGTGSNVLATGVGHLEQSSLPVGGTGSHSVLSAHTGTTNQPLFTDLVLLEIGDIFYLSVLGEKMAYQVDQILTVLPQQIDDIRIDPERDLVTLVTCTPYGVNSHRLLVRGTRIPLEDNTEGTVPETSGGSQNEAPPKANSVWMQHYLQGILYGLGIAAVLILLLVIILFLRKRRTSHRT